MLLSSLSEAGATGADDRRPELQRLGHDESEGGTHDVVVVHSFSRFARDHFALEYHVRRLRKAGVKLISITQDLGDDPMKRDGAAGLRLVR
jgi:DNA invertase Pin-like site-specific DNA recombinase